MRGWLLALTLAGCGGCVGPAPTPVVVTPPPVVTPPIPPPPVTTVGYITDAQYAAIETGANEAQVGVALGVPFRATKAAGYTVWVYAFQNSDSVAWVFFQNGVVVRKSRL
jgi:hypothetical protein